MIIKLSNCNLEYSLSGSGEPIIFLHGWGGDFNSLKSVYSFFDEKKVIAVTFPLLKSDGSAFSIYEYAVIIKELLVKLEIDKISIVGHSFGGRVAIVFACTYADMLDKLILVDSAGIKPRFNLLTKLKKIRYKFAKRLVNANIVDKRCLLKFGSNDYKVLSETEKQTFKNVVNTDLTKLSYYINAPTLILWGKNDKETPLYMAKILHKNIQHSKLIVLKGCGHFVYIDNLSETLKQIRRFL